MLFLFEFVFFALALGVVIAAEALGRHAAVALGLGVTLVSLVARFVVGRRVPLPAGRDRAAYQAASEQARWWQTTLDSWSHFNRALLAGTAVLLAWAMLGRLLST